MVEPINICSKLQTYALQVSYISCKACWKVDKFRNEFVMKPKTISCNLEYGSESKWKVGSGAESKRFGSATLIWQMKLQICLICLKQNETKNLKRNKAKSVKNFLPSEQVVNYADWQVSNLAIKYLREIVNFCETCSDGAQVECFEQKKRLHNMWHCPFNHCFLFFFYYIYRSAVNWQMSPKTLRKS